MVSVVGEIGIAAEEFVVAETGVSLFGTAARMFVNSLLLQGAEYVGGKAVDAIYGPGTFKKLENDIEDLYGSTKELAGEVSTLLYDIRNDTRGYTQGFDAGPGRMKTLEDARAKVVQNALVKPYIKGAAEFAKDFAHLYSGTEVSAGNFEGSGTGLRGIENNKSSVANVLSTLARVNPFYAYLASKVSEKLTDFVTPDDAGYLSVANTYNGVGLYDQNMVLEDLGTNYEFSIVNEAGERVVWKFPEYNNYTVVPPIFGTWTGINSPNNSLCLSGTVGGRSVQSFLDKIAFMHDVGYHDLGSFNEFSDYQLISRANYGRENGLFIFPGEAAAARVAVSYFSTLGKIMRKMFGPSTPSGAPESSTPSGPKESASEVSAGVADETPKEKSVLRTSQRDSIIAQAVAEISSIEGAAEIELDQELIKTELINAVKEIKTSYGSVSVGSSNFALRTALDNLEIQLN